MKQILLAVLAFVHLPSVYAVERGKLVGGGRLGLLDKGPVDDRVLDLVGDLAEDRAGVLVHERCREPCTSLGSLLM